MKDEFHPEGRFNRDVRHTKPIIPLYLFKVAIFIFVVEGTRVKVSYPALWQGSLGISSRSPEGPRTPFLNSWNRSADDLYINYANTYILSPTSISHDILPEHACMVNSDHACDSIANSGHEDRCFGLIELPMRWKVISKQGGERCLGAKTCPCFLKHIAGGKSYFSNTLHPCCFERRPLSQSIKPTAPSLIQRVICP